LVGRRLNRATSKTRTCVRFSMTRHLGWECGFDHEPVLPPPRAGGGRRDPAGADGSGWRLHASRRPAFRARLYWGAAGRGLGPPVPGRPEAKWVNPTRRLQGLGSVRRGRHSPRARWSRSPAPARGGRERRSPSGTRGSAWTPPWSSRPSASTRRDRAWSAVSEQRTIPHPTKLCQRL
jgi:hypothetical protein